MSSAFRPSREAVEESLRRQISLLERERDALRAELAPLRAELECHKTARARLERILGLRKDNEAARLKEADAADPLGTSARMAALEVDP